MNHMVPPTPPTRGGTDLASEVAPIQDAIAQLRYRIAEAGIDMVESAPLSVILDSLDDRLATTQRLVHDLLITEAR